MEVEYGYCFCGCGMKTTIAKQTDKRHGRIKGEPMKFIRGHYAKVNPKAGQSSPHWKGGKVIARQRINSYFKATTECR